MVWSVEKLLHVFFFTIIPKLQYHSKGKENTLHNYLPVNARAENTFSWAVLTLLEEDFFSFAQ